MDGTSLVGHVPRKISYICYIFLLHSGSIICHVTGPKQYSPDLEQGGLYVPHEYRFYSKDKRVKVTRKLLELASFPTKDIVEVKASATAPLTSSKDTSTESYARVEVSSIYSATSHSTTSTSHSTATSSVISSTISCSTAHSVTTLAISQSTTGSTTSSAAYASSIITGELPDIVKRGGWQCLKLVCN